MDVCHESICPRLDPRLTLRLVRRVLSLSASLNGNFFESILDGAKAQDKHRTLMA